MRKIINTSKITLVLFLLFLGITNTQAAVNDCLLDVFQAELKEKNSDKLYDYFLNKSEKDCNKAFEAWKVLYQADENADRLNIGNIETVLAFMVSAEKTVEEMVANIKYVKGFEIWKNLEYQFQKEGYTYFFETDMEPGGIKTMDHFVRKDGEGRIYCGSSTIYPDRKLENTFQIKKELRRKGISKAIYDNVLKENIESIHTQFYDSETRYDSDNYKAFMNEYNANISKDKEKAALATPSGKVLDKRGWEPKNIRVKKDEVTMVWVKKGTVYNSPLNATVYKYKFEEEGYEYIYEPSDTDPNIMMHYVIKDEEEVIDCAVSIMTEDVLNIVLDVPEMLWDMEVYKAIYNSILKEGALKISSVYDKSSELKFSNDFNNYTAFMKEFNKGKDKVKAALATPEGKIFEGLYEPTDIQVKENKVLLVWVKKGTGSSELNEPWINSLPTGLRAQLFAEKGEMYTLFKTVDANERAKLAKSWEVLKNAAGLYYQVPMVIKLSTIGDKFHYNGIKGFDALKPLFTTNTTDHPDLNLLSKEMDFIKNLSGLESLFKSTNDLPVSFSCVKNATYYDPIVLDESGDVIIKVEAGNIVKNKFFDNVDDSYEKVGEYNGFGIFRKGDEIGFKRNVVNLNTNVKYQFQREGYTYKPNEEILSTGVKRIHHYIHKGEESIECGLSRISPNGILSNEFNIPKDLREKGISKAIYEHVFKSDIKSISSSYVKGNPPFDPINYNAFTKAFAESNDKVKAALATPEGKVIGVNWEPQKVEIYDEYISVTWVRRGESEVNVEPWVNNLPADLRGDLFKFKAELYPLFRDADQEYRRSLTKSWEALQNYPQFRTMPKYLKIISKVGEKFKYEGEEGFKVLELVRGKITEAGQQKFLIESLELLDEVFYNIKDLPINISYKQGKEFQYITVIIDGAGDEVMNGLNDFEVMKVFNHVDESYEIVGDYEGNSIMRKGNEIGFMPSAGEEIISNEQWTMGLPQELRAYLFNEEKLYQLFKNADEPYRKRLTKSWEVLESADDMNKEWKNLIKLSPIGDRFEYKGKKGFQAMKFLFTSSLSENYIVSARYEMNIINAFDKLNSLFKNSDDLPISYSCIGNEMYYDPVVLDGVKDQILIIKEGEIIKKKFFDNVDDSYEKVGEYNGSGIFRKGDEIGFKSADVININR